MQVFIHLCSASASEAGVCIITSQCVIAQAESARLISIKQLKKRKDELMEKDASRDRIKLIDSKITAHMKRINDKVKAREEALVE
jgi:hypothetical protein